MYTDISQIGINKMFSNSSSLATMGRQFPMPGQAQYFGLGQGSDGKMPCALTFTGKKYFSMLKFKTFLKLKAFNKMLISFELWQLE